MTLEKLLIFSVLVGLLSLWHQEGNDRIHILSFVALAPGSLVGMGGAGGGASVIPRLINANTEGDNTLSGISSHS